MLQNLILVLYNRLRNDTGISSFWLTSSSWLTNQHFGARGVDWRKGTRGWDDWVVLGGKHGVGVVVRDLSTSRLHPC